MCGIIGSYNSNFDVRKGLDRIKHRGPDGSGVIKSGNLVHGHVRLSILDPTPRSNQPFSYENGIISFNGEIWNYKDISTQLSLKYGFKPETTSDTEVLTAGLYYEGVSVLNKLDGFFSFAYNDSKISILARDRFGKIPLYILKNGSSFIWASERKAFGKLAKYASPLPPGTYLNLKDGMIYRYYNIMNYLKTSSGSLLDLLTHGVEKRMISDVPLCCLISGGLDSSLILLLAKKLNPAIEAYTAVYDRSSPDYKAAKQLCKEKNIPLTEVEVQDPSDKTVVEAIHTIEINSKAQIEIAMLCLPLAKQIQKDGFKVCLSGEGADELFGGYGNMAIKASKAGEKKWQDIRLYQLDEMSRGNFIRCNKVFMAYGVECRLPFLDRLLVEKTLSMSKLECPPGKKALKNAAFPIVPGWVTKRQKETFQGASGIAGACSKLYSSPIKFYNSVISNEFGGLINA